MTTRADKLAFAEDMVELLEAQLKETVGVSATSTDGMSLTVAPDLERKLEYWRKQVIRYSRANSRASSINLANSHD